jgi:hypothetical protein
MELMVELGFDDNVDTLLISIKEADVISIIVCNLISRTQPRHREISVSNYYDQQ